ncbi:MAG: N-formylglutamate amidohydrolase [Chthoniobacteraceae bacterium]
MSLLAPDEPAPVILERAESPAPFVITCDHAGQLIPRRLGDLGVSAAERARHIGWDIGALGVARMLAVRLDAVLIAQRYSRLVIDCNRPPDNPDLCCERSEATDIPGNRGLDLHARAERLAAIHAPYHAAIAAVLEKRTAAGRASIYMAVHSFTPRHHRVDRPWHVGVVHGRDVRLATPLLERLRAEPGIVVGDNEPYCIDEKDHGIPAHAEARGLPHVLLELRQDLIASVGGQQAWGERLAAALADASRGL